MIWPIFVSLVVFLAACSSAPMRGPAGGNQEVMPAVPAVIPAPQAAIKPPPRLPPTPLGGGYYKDDGPGDNPPADLDSVPDAEPRWEPLHRFANRPYSVFGRDYVPMTQVASYRARGVASWYGRKFHGQPTSSGETYDMYGMTAAHPTLPIPSYARINNPASGKSVVVRINDRGPFHADRAIDLSYTAAYKLGIVNGGSALVEIEALLPGGAEPAMDPIERIALATRLEPTRTTVETSDARGIFLQLGAFSNRDNAESFMAKLAREEDLGAPLTMSTQGGTFRVNLGPYSHHAQARRAADRLRQLFSLPSLLVERKSL